MLLNSLDTVQSGNQEGGPLKRGAFLTLTSGVCRRLQGGGRASGHWPVKGVVVGTDQAQENPAPILSDGPSTCHGGSGKVTTSVSGRTLKEAIKRLVHGEGIRKLLQT